MTADRADYGREKHQMESNQGVSCVGDEWVVGAPNLFVSRKVPEIG